MVEATSRDSAVIGLGRGLGGEGSVGFIALLVILTRGQLCVIVLTPASVISSTKAQEKQ